MNRSLSHRHFPSTHTANTTRTASLVGVAGEEQSSRT